MLIEILAADLLDRQPKDVVAYTLEQFLGTTPPLNFFRLHAEAINRDELAFLERYLSQWPGAFYSSVLTHERGFEEMKTLDGVISIGFLMSLPSDMFLDVIYQEFFNRSVDESGAQEYGDIDFGVPSNRLKVIEVFSQSTEFIDNPKRKQIAAPVGRIQSLESGRVPALYWNSRVAISEKWYASGPMPTSLSGRYIPIVLWLPEKKYLYTLSGIQLSGQLDGNLLRANPEWALWGPKTSLRKGDYLLKVNLEGSEGDLFILDVCALGGTHELKKIEFFGQINLQLPLHLNQDLEELEIRIFNFTGRSVEIRLNEISISPR